ncbi:MAG: AbrB/MazE/SpoVT family DNA-binding domain-containing protein [Ktedonobacteraceae bacterium]
MENIRAKITEDGNIRIPADYLQALGLHVGNEIIIRLEDDGLHIFTPQQAIKHAQKLVKQYIPRDISLADELLKERRLEE